MNVSLTLVQIRNHVSFKNSDPGMVAHTCKTSYSRGRNVRIESLRPGWAKLVSSSLKYKIKTKRLGR
jgi:hypothetical protein